MKFVYQYKTSDNVPHEDLIVASSRDAAYRKVKSLGRNPYNVRLAPGVINKMLGLGKRWFFIFFLILVIAAMSIILTSVRELGPIVVDPTLDGSSASVEPLPRRAVKATEKEIAGCLTALFKYRSERFLACYAQPGIELDCVSEHSLEDLQEALSDPIIRGQIDVETGTWQDSLRRIVEGMKRDAAGMLSEGKSNADIAMWLRSRFVMECDYQRQILESSGTDYEKNLRLNSVGLKKVQDLVDKP